MVTDQCHMTENPQEGTSIQSKKKYSIQNLFGNHEMLKIWKYP